MGLIMADLFKRLKEETSSGDIAYARGDTFRNPTPEEEELMADKSGEDNKENEKDQLGRLKKVVNTTAEARLRVVKEEVEARIPLLKKEIVKALTDIVRASKLSANQFINTFRNSRDLTPNTAVVKYFRQQTSFAELSSNLPDDVGELEIILAAIKERKPLAAYDPFYGMHTLCAATVATNVGTQVIYQGYIDLNFVETEKLTIGDKQKAAEIDDASVKVKGTLVYPVGGIFGRRFYVELKDLLLTDKVAQKDEPQ